MSIHSAAGRRLGLSSEQMEELLELDRKKFDDREWLALKYAQDRAFLDGAEPMGTYVEEYRQSYAKEEQGRIAKLVTVMIFANYWNNTFRRRAWKEEMEGASVSCCPKTGGLP